MNTITHEDQKRIWDEEHAHPLVLTQINSGDVSSGVEMLFDFLVANDAPHTSGIEMGCGKGRNSVWLAGKGIFMRAFDFSPTAIAEAKKRAAHTSSNPQFVVLDATQPWPYDSRSFDIGIDCFASTDIESSGGRRFAIQEMYRVLKPGGHVLAYLLSTDDQYHRETTLNSPADERGAFLHPLTGKFEKTFDNAEIAKLYTGFALIQQRELHKQTEFFGKPYECINIWSVFRKER